jgi:hypothetical protein
LIKIFIILSFFLSYNICFGQSDTVIHKDSNGVLIQKIVGKTPSLLYDVDKQQNSTSDSSIIIIDGVVTYGRNFEVEYGTMHTCKFSNISSTKNDWYITNSIGYAPEESKPVFYVTLQTTHDNKIFYGLRGGVYIHHKDLDEAVNEFLQSLGPLNAGQYSVMGNFATTRTPTYIGALSGGYNLNYYFTIDASFGFKYYRDDTYYGEINFSVPANGTPLPEGSVTPGMPFYIVESKDIVKAYYSLGMNYRVGNLTRIGVFADNIYSFGANFSIEF